MSSQKRNIAALVVIIVVVLAGAIYYSGLQQPPTPPPKPTPTVTAPKVEKALVVGTSYKFFNPDIQIGSYELDAPLDMLLADHLFVVDAVKPGMYHSNIVESYEMFNKTGKPYIDFKIRKGLVTQDGSPINASTIKWAYEREQTLDVWHRYWHQSSYTKLVVVDSHLLRMHLKTTFVPLLFGGIMGQLQHGFIVSPKAGNWNPNVTGFDVRGSGPYMVQEYVKGERIVLVPWKDYGGSQGTFSDGMKHRSYADKITIKQYADAASLRLALERGDVDMGWASWTPVDILAFEKNPQLKVDRSYYGRLVHLIMSWRYPPFDNVLARRAVAYALNVKELWEKTQRGLSQRALSCIRPSFPYYKPYHDQLYNLSYAEIDMAKKLLTQAGYPTGVKTYLWYEETVDPDIPTVIQAQLAKAGITVELKPMEPGLMRAKRISGEINGMYYSIWTPDYPDPDTDIAWAMVDMNHTGRGWVYYRYSNPRADYLVDLEQKLYDPLIPAEENLERARVFDELQRIHAEDVIYVPLWIDANFEVYRADVKGYHLYAHQGFWKPVWNAYKDTWGITTSPDWNTFRDWPPPQLSLSEEWPTRPAIGIATAYPMSLQRKSGKSDN